ncbi:hypothetical protein KAT92_01200 [Candidatus Babeliales bacterium]|nr:hypothetical protein [Candidatus Babeliales bacterium]
MNISKKTLLLFSSVFLIKVIFLAFFSSNYQNQLFIPFVKHFLSKLDNPWNHFYHAKSLVDFPYHPLMLYLLSFFYLPIHLFKIQSIVLQNLFFKIPLLLSDIAITTILFKIFPYKKYSILIFYTLSPIIFYSSFIHSQLDLIPTMLLFLSIYLLQKNVGTASIFFGLALSTKLHVITALPLVLIYLYKKKSFNLAFYFLAISIMVYCIFSVPYLLSPGLYHLAIAGTKQKTIFQTYAKIGDLKLYLPIFGILVIYGRFVSYQKINRDLLNSFITLTFATFVMLIFPAPGWYVWFLPFLSTLFIRTYHENKSILAFYFLLNCTYLLFFIFFYIPEFTDILFLNMPLDLKLHNELLRNSVFSILEATLFLAIYSCYKYGIRSNDIYKKKNSMVIGVGGDSGTGKTTLLSDLKNLLGSKLTHLEGDGDHKWDRYSTNWKHFTHLNPKANLLHRQTENIVHLKNKKPIWRTDYDHNTGFFTPAQKIDPNDFIAISGLHPFYLPKTRKLIDLKIYLNPSIDVQCHWKMLRDTKLRGHSKEKVLEQIKKRKLDSKKYINPQKNFSDIIVHYFTDSSLVIGKDGSVDNLKLKLTMNSNFQIESLIDKLIENNVPMEWDYSDNLQEQYIVLPKPIPTTLLSSLAKQIIPNIEELTSPAALWANGYRGTIQLISLLALSEKMKDADIPS